jgi:hypothetical protein
MRNTLLTLTILLTINASAWAYLPGDLRAPRVKVTRASKNAGDLHLNVHRNPLKAARIRGMRGDVAHGKTYLPVYHDHTLARVAHTRYYGSFGWESPVGPWSNAVYGQPRAGEPVFYP